MRHWWRDTLFKRLFLLMWFGLVGSNLLAFWSVQELDFHLNPDDRLERMRVPPVMPSLPPGPLSMGAPNGAIPPPNPQWHGRFPGNRPPHIIWLDYCVRFLAIGVVAWFGARWLSLPMRRLAQASEHLGQSLGTGRLPPALEEHSGSLEVRQTAQVFNAMATRLQAQFESQNLLMAAISHDLRTPLARLRLRLETLGQGPQAERAVADVREMDHLIGNVLGMMRERHAASAPRKIDLAALVQSLVDDLSEQGAAARIDKLDPAIVSAQPGALTRVLDNLIGNALRHAGSARVSILQEGNCAKVQIDDNGPGIPDDQLEAVFQAFYRLDGRQHSVAAAGGSGLGLYIARDLAQRSGGTLRLRNRPEGGLRAELSLPID